MSRWYGNLNNRLMENNAFSKVKVGDGATLTSYSDRTAGTVIEMFEQGKAKYVVIQEDTAIRTDDRGMSESQEYKFEKNPKGNISTFKLLPGKPWRQVIKNTKGRYIISEGYGLSLGHRSEYYDYSF